MATNSGTFSVSHDDGSFSAQGSFSSSGSFGEMGTERNGVFANPDDGDNNAGLQPAESIQVPESVPLAVRSRIKRAQK